MESKIPRTNDLFHIILKTTSQFKVMESIKIVLEKEPAWMMKKLNEGRDRSVSALGDLVWFYWNMMVSSSLLESLLGLTPHSMKNVRFLVRECYSFSGG